MSFRVLTDWQTGDPPMPGLWLTRPRGMSDVAEVFLRWDGGRFQYPDGSPTTVHREWRGLAFNPESARSMRLTFGVAPSGEQRVQSGYFVEQA